MDGALSFSAADVWIQEYLRHRRIPHRVVAAGDPPLHWGHAVVHVIHPAAALISVGHRNPFRHPHPEIVARYQAVGARIWRTDRNGAISVEMQPGQTRVQGRREE